MLKFCKILWWLIFAALATSVELVTVVTIFQLDAPRSIFVGLLPPVIDIIGGKLLIKRGAYDVIPDEVVKLFWGMLTVVLALVGFAVYGFSNNALLGIAAITTVRAGLYWLYLRLV